MHFKKSHCLNCNLSERPGEADIEAHIEVKMFVSYHRKLKDKLCLDPHLLNLCPHP